MCRKKSQWKSIRISREIFDDEAPGLRLGGLFISSANLLLWFHPFMEIREFRSIKKHFYRKQSLASLNKDSLMKLYYP